MSYREELLKLANEYDQATAKLAKTIASASRRGAALVKRIENGEPKSRGAKLAEKAGLLDRPSPDQIVATIDAAVEQERSANAAVLDKATRVMTREIATLKDRVAELEKGLEGRDAYAEGFEAGKRTATAQWVQEFEAMKVDTGIGVPRQPANLRPVFNAFLERQKSN
jgi:post-segregation antitoxin (ccd killing protein)